MTYLVEAHVEVCDLLLSPDNLLRFRVGEGKGVLTGAQVDFMFRGWLTGVQSMYVQSSIICLCREETIHVQREGPSNHPRRMCSEDDDDSGAIRLCTRGVVDFVCM